MGRYVPGVFLDSLRTVYSGPPGPGGWALRRLPADFALVVVGSSGPGCEARR